MKNQKGRKKRKYTIRKERKKKLYVVYNNATDLPVFIDGTAEECAKAMGLKNEASFRQAYRRHRMGYKTKWWIAESDTQNKELLE